MVAAVYKTDKTELRGWRQVVCACGPCSTETNKASIKSTIGAGHHYERLVADALRSRFRAAYFHVMCFSVTQGLYPSTTFSTYYTDDLLFMSVYTVIFYLYLLFCFHFHRSCLFVGSLVHWLVGWLVGWLVRSFVRSLTSGH